MKPTLRALALTLPLAMLSLTACSASDESSEATPQDGGTINIVTSTQVWADVAQATVGDADVNAIIVGDSADPHSFEPTAADMAKVETADIIVVGGGGYDAWLYSSLDDNDSRIIHALPLSEHDHGDEHDGDDHDHGGDVDNEHIWYSTEAVSEVAGDIADKASELDSNITVTPQAVTAKMDELHGRIHDLPAVRVAQTEPIADYIVKDSAMIESTPEGYRATTLSEGEPSAADVDSFQELIRNNGIDILIYNPQSATPVATSLRDLAQENGIAIVEISETPPLGENFLDTFTTAVDNLEKAATSA
ncbi:metal ABC transporter solute-binding protein, Zn/Mn family [Corynebacterium pacaense]|uniref:metal ABC transporter solute-binding protein, Zn/Mn family n=1 Tax=Corynebacterium pacaense TaxID=1816684 RepID=UPI0009BA69CA|nr:zinc ABC transporter substrate-binding protein [Corynebacterium pacaense]